MSFATSSLRRTACAAVGIAAASATAAAQVTTASLGGRVTLSTGQPASTATVLAVHQPSGTSYRATPRADGRFTIPGMRVGGPYTVTVRALGFAPGSRTGISLSLGNQTEVDFVLTQAAVQLQSVQVTGTAGQVSSERTGAATRVSTQVIQNLPTISRTIQDFTRLTPQAANNGNNFAGFSANSNNITVDGAFFNNSFGLAGQPGGRTNTAPIPLDAVDQIQVNIAPYDVRQGNFVGAGVNAVTRSGTNSFEGSVYYIGRNEEFNGTRAADVTLTRNTFSFGQVGARLGGPILRNRLFFFLNAEDDRFQQPGTTFLARESAATAVGGNTTRVLLSDVQRLSSFLSDSLGYNPGPIQFTNETPSRRYLAKLDLNANEQNKFSLRFSQSKSTAQIPVSNSTALGFGNRRDNLQSLSFGNSRYGQVENVGSLVGEWNATYGRVANNLIVGYNESNENRQAIGGLFPTVDILQEGQTYLNFGFEPFTPANQLTYNSFQVQNNFQVFLKKHELTFGGFYERFRSKNVFFPGSQSVYSYNSLEDFITDARGFLANPNRTTSPVTLRRFQVRYSNVPGLSEPVQPLGVNSYGLFAQDQWRPTERVTLTLGLRADLPVFDETGFTNAQAYALSVADQNGGAARFQTQALPKNNILWSPRLGFNYDVAGDRSTTVRGGTGIFSGRPPFVWISNQIGQNGILTGFVEDNNVTNRPFNPNPLAYVPATVTGAPASSYELNFSDPNFRFPQQWRSNLAVDQRLPWGVLGTAEVLYGRDVQGAYYYDANLRQPVGTLAGPDRRPTWLAPGQTAAQLLAAQRINSNITRALVLANQNVGYNYNVAVSLEKSFASGLYAKTAYSYGDAFNVIDPGSTANGTFTGLQVPGNPNQAPRSRSNFAAGHRSFVALSYRREYFKLGATTVSLFANRGTINYLSYTTSGDLNGDGVANNDLLYVPRDRSEMTFVPLTVTQAGGASVVYTPQQQADAFEAYINQDPYLRTRRGQYAERNGFRLPQLLRADFSIAQDVFRPIAGKRNSIQIRLDVFNAGNLLNRNWGVSQAVTNLQPLAFAGVDATGRPTYRFRNVNTQLLQNTYIRTASPTLDVYRMQLGARYTFQ
jgi:outer membrane receptor protein involved in Fe transport